MQYGTLSLKVKPGTLAIAPAKAKEIVHYPSTNSNESFDLGRPATLIRCTVLASSENEVLAIQAAAHGNTKQRLTLDRPACYYEQVTMEIETGAIREIAPNCWEIPVLFTCLDPIPYSLSGVKLYG